MANYQQRLEAMTNYVGGFGLGIRGRINRLAENGIDFVGVPRSIFTVYSVGMGSLEWDSDSELD